MTAPDVKAAKDRDVLNALASSSARSLSKLLDENAALKDARDALAARVEQLETALREADRLLAWWHGTYEPHTRREWDYEKCEPCRPIREKVRAALAASRPATSDFDPLGLDPGIPSTGQEYRDANQTPCGRTDLDPHRPHHWRRKPDGSYGDYDDEGDLLWCPGSRPATSEEVPA